MLNFNINDNVRVKLTPYGKKMLKEDYFTYWNEYNPRMLMEYMAPKEDEYGYSTWQLWDLMAHLGKYQTLGKVELPFETDILIED